MLAALYDDHDTFYKLHNVVQAGIIIGGFGLFPWTWSISGDKYKYGGEYGWSGGLGQYDSASDGDTNIALAYIYAGNTNWDHANHPSSSDYLSFAKTYIENIRMHDICGNLHLLGDGKVTGINSYHPDYSDLRAFELFAKYDSSANFWQTVIDNTIIVWKTIFNFGSSDTRSEYPSTDRWSSGVNQQLKNELYHTNLSNAKYVDINQNTSISNFENITIRRTGDKYTNDCQRMPIRLAYYLNQESNNIHADISGIASSIQYALKMSYTTNGKLSNQINIYRTWDNTGGYIQNYTAVGLFILSNCKHLTTDTAIYINFKHRFGNFNDTGVPANGNLHMPTNGYNIALTLWGLTISKGGHTPLLTHIHSL